MGAWWDSLTRVNQGFFCAAAFFSVFFLWQMLAALFGLGGEDAGHDASDAGGGVDGNADQFDSGAQVDATETVVAFKLLSIRAIVTFCTLFSWGGALYLSRGDGLARSMGISVIWGLAGMGSVALVLSLLPKLAHTGTTRLASSVGTRGAVYLDIPKGGLGEVRVEVSGVIAYVKARACGGGAIKTGTQVIVKRALDETTVEVEAVSGTSEGGKE